MKVLGRIFLNSRTYGKTERRKDVKTERCKDGKTEFFFVRCRRTYVPNNAKPIIKDLLFKIDLQTHISEQPAT